MKPHHQKVLKEALGLPPEAHAALAGRLLNSLEDSIDEDAESAWSEEIARRIDDLDFGFSIAGSSDYSVRSCQHIRWYRQPYLLGGLEIDDEIEFLRLLDR